MFGIVPVFSCFKIHFLMYIDLIVWNLHFNVVIDESTNLLFNLNIKYTLKLRRLLVTD